MSKNRSNTNAGKHEVRVSAAPQKFEIRSNADGSRTISGYAVTWQDLSQDLGGFKEKVQKGAFTQSLRDRDVMILYGHDQNQILGRVSSGTLTLAEDERGLKFSCKLPNTSTANDLVELMSRQDVRSMSFGFSVPEGGDDWQDINGQVVRTLLQVVLYEISVVGDPAYTTSSVNLRSAPAAIRAILTGGKSVLGLDDPDDLSTPDDPDTTPADDQDVEDDEEERCSDPRCAFRCPQHSHPNAGDSTEVAERKAYLDLLVRRIR